MAHKDILEYGEFISSVRQNRDSKFGFLLGAGRHYRQGYNLHLIVFGIGREKSIVGIMKVIVLISRMPGLNLLVFKYKNGLMYKDVIQNQAQKREYVFYAEKAYPIASDRIRYFNSLIHDKSTIYRI